VVTQNTDAEANPAETVQRYVGSHFEHSRTTEVANVVSGLGALAHQGRLEVVRLLVRAGEAGVSAGQIARATGSLPNTLSMNLNVLRNAGLIRSRRDGTSIIYSAAYDRMSDLLDFLIENCGGENATGKSPY
jgi:DNA-binding transcriptional ArsR family regulator